MLTGWHNQEKKPDDHVVHVGTNDINNNVNLLTNIKKNLQWSPSTSIAFSSIINGKDKTNTQKTLTNANASLKNFCIQKGTSFIDTCINLISTRGKGGGGGGISPPLPSFKIFYITQKLAKLVSRNFVTFEKFAISKPLKGQRVEFIPLALRNPQNPWR